MLAIRADRNAMKATTTIRSATKLPKWYRNMKMIGDPVTPSAFLTPVGMAIEKIAKMTNPAAVEIQTVRNIAFGAVRRGSRVSSARSADPSQPISVYTGSRTASMTDVKVTGLPVDVPTCVRIAGPASLLKKNKPMAMTSARPSVPISSTPAPRLLTQVAARTPMALRMVPTAIMTTPNSWMSPVVGWFHTYGAKTDPMAMDRPAVPAVKASIAHQPVNQPIWP